jgi:hypothetical protein
MHGVGLHSNGGALFKNLLARLFGRSSASRLSAGDRAHWETALLEQVREMSSGDPLIGAKIGGKELAQRLIAAMTNDRGVHVESLLCAAGALAGYSCQAAVRAKNRAQGHDEVAHLTVAEASDGQRYFFGDLLNKYVAESELSVWSIAAGGAQRCGCANLPDINPIFKHVAQSVGTENFGVPRLPEEHPVHELPRSYLERFWPQFFPMVERFCPNPDHWPALFGLAIQDLLSQTKGALDPCLSLQVVMESAIPMSKVNAVAR